MLVCYVIEHGNGNPNLLSNATHGAVLDALVEKLETIVNMNCALEEYHQQRQSEI